MKSSVIFQYLEERNLLEDYHLIVQRRFAGPSDLDHYGGGWISFW
jgi:hypothetical protein